MLFDRGPIEGQSVSGWRDNGGDLKDFDVADVVDESCSGRGWGTDDGNCFTESEYVENRKEKGLIQSFKNQWILVEARRA